MVKVGYQQTQIGVFPTDWDQRPLEEISKRNGLVRGPFGGTLKKEIFEKQGFKIYEQRNAIYCSEDLGDYYVNESKFCALKRFEVKPGDFIVSCSGTIGCIFQIPPGAQKGIINQALLKISIDDKIINDRFFLFVFRWDKFKERILENTHGGAMQNLVSMAVFKNTLIPLPSIKEQRTIATALSDVDALIAALDKLIVKKCAIKTAVMQQLLTGKKRLPGFSGPWKVINMDKHSVLKARIGWQGLKTDEYLENGEYFLVTGTDFLNGRINWGNCFCVDQWRYAQDKNIQLKNDDVLITKDGTIGKIGYVDYLPGPATLNSGVFVIRPIGEAYYPLFLYYVLSSEVFDEFLRKLQAGSTISHLYQKDFVNFEFVAPDIKEQKAIAETLSDMDAEITALESRLNKTQAIKQGMMQELLTGRTRLI